MSMALGVLKPFEGGLADPFQAPEASGPDFAPGVEVRLDFADVPPPVEIVVNGKTGFTAVVDVRSPSSTEVGERATGRGEIDWVKGGQELLKVLGTGVATLKVAGELGQLPLPAIYAGGGAGLGAMANGAGGVVGAGLTGLAIGRGIDWTITHFAGESLGEMVYDRFHPGE